MNWSRTENDDVSKINDYEKITKFLAQRGNQLNMKLGGLHLHK